jgi:hypothetical protein
MTLRSKEAASGNRQHTVSTLDIIGLSVVD